MITEVFLDLFTGPGLLSVASFGFIFSLYKGWIPFTDNIGALSTVLATAIGLIVFGYNAYEARLALWFQCTSKPKSWMPIYVSRLQTSDISSLIFLIFLKYLYKPLFLLPKLRVASDGEHFDLPELQISASLKADASDKARYDAATKGTPATSSSSSSSSSNNDQLMLLPALTTPMLIALLANRHNPVLPFGSVNTKNRFEFLDPEACRNPEHLLDLPRAVVSGKFGGESLPGRRVKRGMEFGVEIELRAPRVGQKESKVVFRQSIKTLQFLSASTKPAYTAPESKVGIEEEAEAEGMEWSSDQGARVDLDLSAPTKWAALCSDYNPIHLSRSMAKFFGFSGQIAHGNHVVACVLQRLQSWSRSAGGTGKRNDTAQAAMQNLIASNQPSYLEVQFKRPVILPTQLDTRFGSSRGSKSFGFSAEKDGKEYVIGKLGALAS